MRIVNEKGLSVIPAGNGIPHDILNVRAVQNAEATLEETASSEDDTKWKDLARRLEAGEKIEGVALTPQGYLTFYHSDVAL